MNELARTALKRLLRQADRKVAGVAKKMPSLTARHLQDYQALRSLPEKEEFDASLKHAQVIGAIRLYWPPGNRDGFIERVELVDISKLAGLLEARRSREPESRLGLRLHSPNSSCRHPRLHLKTRPPSRPRFPPHGAPSCPVGRPAFLERMSRLNSGSA